MRKVLSLSLVLNVCLTLGLLSFTNSSPEPAHATGELECGDLDANGEVQVADAVYLINWLFANGPDPVCLEPQPCLLPATGQSKCFDDFGNEISCGDPAFPGQDGFHQSGCSNEGRFVDNGDGTVTDNCTRLMWEKASAPLIGGFNWSRALDRCENMTLAGHDDWRMPNAIEAITIINYGTISAPHGVTYSYPEFNRVNGDTMWTSTTDQASHPDRAYEASFIRGTVFAGVSKESNRSVRAVRTVQLGE